MTHRKAWAVSNGSYSSYRVQCLFERRADATAYAKGSGGFVEEFWFYAKGERPESVPWFDAEVTLWDNGEIGDPEVRPKTVKGTAPWYESSFYEKSDVEFECEVPEGRPKVTFVRAPIHGGKGGRLEAIGRDKVAVTKALSDYIAEWIVESGSSAKVPEVIWSKVDW